MGSILVPNVSPAGLTLLGSTTLSGASVTFSSIPLRFVSLKLIVRNFLPSSSAQLGLRFNADATANRHGTMLAINGNITPDATRGLVSRTAPTTGGAPSLITVDINDYANAVTWKSFISYSQVSESLNPTTLADCGIFYGTYNQTTAITSLELLPTAGNFTSGTARLYGVN